MATPPPGFDLQQYIKDYTPELIARLFVQRSPILEKLAPVTYPHFDSRGVYRYRPRTFFEILTPAGRLRVLNRKARMKRLGMPEPVIQFTVSKYRTPGQYGRNERRE